MPGVLLVVGGGGASSSAFAANLNRSLVQGVGFTPGTIQTSNAVTCTGVNGIPPYSYEWLYVSGNVDIYPNTGTSGTTRFSIYTMTPDTYSAFWRCEVTDSAFNTVFSTNVEIVLEGNP